MAKRLDQMDQPEDLEDGDLLYCLRGNVDLAVPMSKVALKASELLGDAVERAETAASTSVEKAAEVEADAASIQQALADAEAIVYGGGYSTTPAPGNVPIALSTGRLADGWLGPNSISNPKALANAIHMTAAESGGTGIRALPSINNNLGAGDFTLIWRGALPDWSPAASVNLLYKFQSAQTRVWFRIMPSGTLRFDVHVGSVLVVSSESTATIESSGFAAWSTIEIALAVTRETASSPGSVVFALNGIQLGSAIAITPAAPVSFNNTGNWLVSGYNNSEGRAESITFAAYIYNRALSVTELLNCAVNGVNTIDVGASNAPVYASDFSAGADGWVNRFGVGFTGNVDGIGGEDNWLQLRSAGGGSNYRAYRDLGPALRGTANKLLRIKLYVPSTNTAARGLRPTWAAGASADTTIRTMPAIIPPLNTVTEFVVRNDVNVSAATRLLLALVPESGSTSGNLALDDAVYIKISEVLETGNIARYEPDGIQAGGQWLDSANGNHALIPAGTGVTVMHPPRINQQRGTNTWAGTSETQYVGGFNQAVFPANSALTTLDIHSTGSVTVHIGDGVDVDRYGASVALAAGRNRVTLLTPFNDGTNLKLTLTPTASFTGTLKTTCDYKLQEA